MGRQSSNLMPSDAIRRHQEETQGLQFEDSKMESINPRFSTILAARGNNQRPTDLEFQLRAQCQKVKVVQKLAGRAHLLLPGESSLAVRVYYPGDLDALLESSSKDTALQSTPTTSADISKSDNFDDLGDFAHAFRFTTIVFVVPPDQQKEQLDDFNSFFHRAQRIATKQECLHKSTPKIARILIVPDTESAISSLISVADAIKKLPMKNAFFASQRQKQFLPDELGSMPHKDLAAAHVAGALRDWGNRFDLPSGEVDVLMSMLRTFGDITSSDANTLECTPVDGKTKRLLSSFFESGQAKTNKMSHPKATESSIRNARCAAFRGNTNPINYAKVHHKRLFSARPTNRRLPSTKNMRQFQSTNTVTDEKPKHGFNRTEHYANPFAHSNPYARPIQTQYNQVPWPLPSAPDFPPQLSVETPPHTGYSFEGIRSGTSYAASSYEGRRLPSAVNMHMPQPWMGDNPPPDNSSNGRWY